MPAISVIVPIYNVEEYLTGCVASVSRQTFSDFELILVDDGSPDRCPQLCDGLAKTDSRIRVVHKQNGGLSSARNAGMKLAQGEYLFFLDSDDYLHPMTFETMYRIAREENCDIVSCKFRETQEKYSSYCPQDEGDALCEFFDNREALEKMYSQQHDFSVVACAKLYRTELFREIEYPEGRLHEDEFTTYKLIFRANKIAFLHAKFYNYYQNPQSITHAAYRLQRLDGLTALKEQLVFLEEKKIQRAYRELQWVYVIQLMEHFYQIKKLQQRKDILDQISSELKSQMKSIRDNPDFNWKRHALWLSFCLSPGLFHRIRCRLNG